MNEYLLETTFWYDRGFGNPPTPLWYVRDVRDDSGRGGSRGSVSEALRGVGVVSVEQVLRAMISYGRIFDIDDLLVRSFGTYLILMTFWYVGRWGQRE